MNIIFDKRLDLLFGLIYAVNKDNNCGFNFADSPITEYKNKFYDLYKQNITKEFEEFIINKGLGVYDKTVKIANSLNDKYEVIVNPDIEYICSINPNFNPELLSKLLKEFVSISHYDEFYDSFKDLREELINKFRDSMNQYIDFNQSVIEDFYGYSIAPLQIVLSFFSKSAYGQMYDNKQSYITGLYNYKDGEFDKNIIHILFHEFAHPYINPLGYEYFKDIDINALFNLAKDNGLGKQYNNPIVFINEYVVRAIQIISISNIFDQQEINNLIEEQENKGYLHIKELIDIFKNKDNYDSFEDFYKKEIVNFFIVLNNRVSSLNMI